MQTKIIKDLSASNLGKKGMHDTYIAIPAKYRKDGTQEDFFGTKEKSFDFIDSVSGKTHRVSFKPEKNGEFRIAKLGPYFKEKKPSIGDELHIVKADIVSWKDSFFISIHSKNDRYFSMPDEMDNLYSNKKDQKYIEGHSQKVPVNKYERSKSARDECLKHYGAICKCCGIDFEKTYGEIGKGFIHVHHIIPISQIKKIYIINPIEDLIPVCPNCHAMIHKRNPPYQVNEIIEILNENFDQKN